MNPITRLLTTATHQLELQDPNIYPLPLPPGDYTTTHYDADPTTWISVTPIINQDHTITITHQGQPIGHITEYITINKNHY